MTFSVQQCAIFRAVQNFDFRSPLLYDCYLLFTVILFEYGRQPVSAITYKLAIKAS